MREFCTLGRDSFDAGNDHWQPELRKAPLTFRQFADGRQEVPGKFPAVTIPPANEHPTMRVPMRWVGSDGSHWEELAFSVQGSGMTTIPIRNSRASTGGAIAGLAIAGMIGVGFRAGVGVLVARALR